MMLDWWTDREPREKSLIVTALGLTVIVGFFQFVLLPSMEQHRRAQEDFQRMSSTKAEVLAGLAYIKQTEFDAPQSSGSDQSLEALVSSSAQTRGLQIIRLQPNGSDRLNVWFDNVDARLLFGWADSLEQSGISVSKASINRRDGGNTVRANLEIIRGPT